MSCPSTASSRLQDKIAFAFPALRQSSERLWAPTCARRMYPRYLVAMHGIMRSATPLMEAALARCTSLSSYDSVAAALVSYLTEHAPEEAGHDRWVVEDLNAMGIDGSAETGSIPSARVAEFVGAQYYWIHHSHPVALLGHMAIVEGHAPTPGFASRLREVTGYPADAFRAIERHEQLDAGHGDELFAFIDTLPLKAHHETLIGVSALHTILAGIAVFDELYTGLGGAAT